MEIPHGSLWRGLYPPTPGKAPALLTVRVTGTCWIKAYFEPAEPTVSAIAGSLPMAAFARRFVRVG